MGSLPLVRDFFASLLLSNASVQDTADEKELEARVRANFKERLHRMNVMNSFSTSLLPLVAFCMATHVKQTEGLQQGNMRATTT